MTPAELHELTAIDPWWLENLAELHRAERWLAGASLADLTEDDFWQAKRRGFSDAQLARLLGASFTDVRLARRDLGVLPRYKRVDTCAAEFAAETPYLYSAWDEECEAAPTTNKKVPCSLSSLDCCRTVPFRAPRSSTTAQRCAKI